MHNFVEEMGITGHLEIEKVYDDGTSEIVFDDHNIIVSGMGVGLSLLFTLSGSTFDEGSGIHKSSITDYQLDRFQVGVSGTSVNEVSSTYSLSGALSSTEEYVGTAGDIITASSTQIKHDEDFTNQVFGIIPFKQVTRINDTSVRYTIVLDKESGNDITRDSTDAGGTAGVTSVPLNEIGLFMKNPTGAATDRSILCAYRVFSDITKTNDFALVFRWTINL